MNADVFAELPDDLKKVVMQACKGLYNPVWTEPMTKHAQALQTLLSEHNVQVSKLTDDVIAVMGVAAQEIMEEYLADEDAWIGRITESFIASRDFVGGYMPDADNGQMNARAGLFNF